MVGSSGKCFYLFQDAENNSIHYSCQCTGLFRVTEPSGEEIISPALYVAPSHSHKFFGDNKLSSRRGNEIDGDFTSSSANGVSLLFRCITLQLKTD
jgi:hypothetical protein